MILPSSKLKNRITYHSKICFSILILGIVVGCKGVKNFAVDNDVRKFLKHSEVFSNQFTGFSLFDLESDQIIVHHNATLKFTPASNTKLLTMYATLKSFQDSIPSFLFKETDSVTFIQPLGDPTILYEPFKNQRVLNKIHKNKKIAISWPKGKLKPYGSGWAWDDYIYNFQAQRSWWPLYGNTVRIKKVNDSLTITPPFFEDYVEVVKQKRPGKLVDRELKYNVFKVYLESNTLDFERTIPFDYSKDLLLELLKDTLQNDIDFTLLKLENPDTLYSQHLDTVLSYMLKSSDNFLAEQLLILAAWKNGFNTIKSFIDYMQFTWLMSFTDMVWVDGSGLSRYNLISPIDQVRLLKRSIDEFGWDRITSILPTGGQGTLKNRFLSEEPYIFAKTGTLSNNHNLSGFLITKSGKRMIFSFMNNHYIRSTSEVKRAMDDFLLEIREAY